MWGVAAMDEAGCPLSIIMHAGANAGADGITIMRKTIPRPRVPAELSYRVFLFAGEEQDMSVIKSGKWRVYIIYTCTYE